MPPKKKIAPKPALLTVPGSLSSASGVDAQDDIVLPSAPPIVRIIGHYSVPSEEEDEALVYVDAPTEVMGSQDSSQDVLGASPTALQALDTPLSESVIPDIALPIPDASTRRSLARQTTAAFTAAGGSPTLATIPRASKASKKSAKVSVVVGGDGLSELDRRMGGVEAMIAELTRDNKATAVEQAVMIERINQLIASSNIKRNPDFKSLHNDHFETRSALNQVSTELSSMFSSTTQSIETLSASISEIADAQQAMENAGPTVPPIVPPPSAPSRVNLPPPRTNGFLSSPHPAVGDKRKERDWEKVHPDRTTHVAREFEVHTEVSFGPIRTPGDIYTRGMDVVRDTESSPDTVLNIRKAEVDIFIVIRFRSLQAARNFVDKIEGNFGGRFRNCKVYIMGPVAARV